MRVVKMTQEYCFGEIKSLISALNANNVEATIRGIFKEIERHGVDIDVYVLKCLIDSLEKAPQDRSVRSCLSSLLTKRMVAAITHPARSTALCHAIKHTVAKNTLRLDNLSFAAKFFNLKSGYEVSLCLHLLNAHDDSEEFLQTVREYAGRKFPEVVSAYLENDRSANQYGGLQDINPEALHLMLSGLHFDSVRLNKSVKDKFLNRLRFDYPRDQVPMILSPFLYLDDGACPIAEDAMAAVPISVMENSVAELLKDIGYSFTSSVDRCREDLLNMTVELTEKVVSVILTTMIRHHSDLDAQCEFVKEGPEWVRVRKDDAFRVTSATWNPEIFVQALKLIQPSLDWKDVVYNLDNGDFFVDCKLALAVLFRTVVYGLQNDSFPSSLFPIAFLYSTWNNRLGQYSLIAQLIRHPDVFDLVEYPYNSVPIDILKSSYDRKDTVWWASADLIRIVIDAIALKYPSASDLIKIPIQICPDVLLIGIIHLRLPLNRLVEDIVSHILPIFFGDHINSTPILNLVWTSAKPLRPLFLSALVRWYAEGQGDSSRLSRIVDITQGYGALPVLLGYGDFPFAIDLAVLAARRTYLKLDMWVEERCAEMGEPFACALVDFLKKHCEALHAEPAQGQLSLDTVQTLLVRLNSHLDRLGQPLVLTIAKLNSLVLQAGQKLRQREIAAGMQRLMGTQPHPQPQLQPQLQPQVQPQLQVQPMSYPIYKPQQAVVPYAVPPPNARPFAPVPLAPIVEVAEPAETPMTSVCDIAKSYLDRLRKDATQETENESSNCFKRLFNDTPTPAGVWKFLETLLFLRDSANHSQRQLYGCIISDLFREFRHFDSYPDRQLELTAQLFGGLIDRKVLCEHGRWIAAINIFNTLVKPANNKMFRFGLLAIEAFKHRLREFSSVCEHLKNLPYYNRFPVTLIEFIDSGAVGELPTSKMVAVPSTSTAPIPGPSRESVPDAAALTQYVSPLTVDHPSVAHASNIDILVAATLETDDSVEVPAERIEDKVMFIFNNLSVRNIEDKTQEMRRVIQQQYKPWLSRFIVMKRASIDMKFHSLYMKLLEHLKWADMFPLLRSETYRNVKVLLKNENDFSNRSLLKNLGHWLGLITLGLNKPILAVDLNIKELLFEAFASGMDAMLFVVPFVSKVLLSCADSVAFKPPNPWTMTLLHILAAIHSEPDLKLNLRFEVEVLCKALQLNLPDLEEKASKLERDKWTWHVTLLSDQTKIAKPARQTIFVAPQPMNEEGDSIIHLSNLPCMELSPLVHPPPNPSFCFEEVTNDFLHHLAVIDPDVRHFSQNPALWDIIIRTIERSVIDYIPVMSPYLSIVKTLCETLQRNDFEHVYDGDLMHASTHNLMRNLVCAFVYHYYQEPLMASIVFQIRTEIINAFSTVQPPASLISKEEIFNKVARGVVKDNYEMILAFAQKITSDVVIQEMDARLLSDYKKVRCAPFEASFRYPLPPILNFNPHRRNQLEVYDELGRSITGFKRTQVPPPLICNLMHQRFNEPPKSTLMMTAAAVSEQTGVDNEHNMVFQGQRQLMLDCEQFIAVHSVYPQFELQVTHIATVREIFKQNIQSNGAFTVIFIKQLVEKLMEGYTPQGASEYNSIMLIYRNLLANILFFLQRMYMLPESKLSLEITRGMIETPEPHRFNLHAVQFLLEKGIVNLPEYDMAVTRMMDGGQNNNGMAFATILVTTYPTAEKDLPLTAEYLARFKAPALIKQPDCGIDHHKPPDPQIFLSQIENSDYAASICQGVQMLKDPMPDPPELISQVEMLLEIWVTTIFTKRECDVDLNLEKFNHFLQKEMILSSEDSACRFFRIAVRICMRHNHSLMQKSEANRNNYYLKPDAFAMLAVYIIKRVNIVTDIAERAKEIRIRLLCKYLGIIAGCLLKDHDENPLLFSSLPYHRMFFKTFCDLNANPGDTLDGCLFEILVSFSYTFHMLRPTEAPQHCTYWIEMIEHRTFLACILNSSYSFRAKAWVLYFILLRDLLQYAYPFLGTLAAPKQRVLLEKAILKILLVIWHDFPTFLSLCRTGLMDEIPLHCHQIRSIITSAIPLKIKLPPRSRYLITPEHCPEMLNNPVLLINFAEHIQPYLREKIDEFLATGYPKEFLEELRMDLQVSKVPGHKYNLKLLNALVIYVAGKAINDLHNCGQSVSPALVTQTPHMELLKDLADNLDYEGWYVFSHAMLANLTYPNTHSHYFRCVAVHLFQTGRLQFREILFRCFCDRIGRNQLVPWALSDALATLVSDPLCHFWEHEFVAYAEEVKKMLIDHLAGP